MPHTIGGATPNVNFNKLGKCRKGLVATRRSVCRFHGAGGGHEAGKAHPSFRHGMRSREFIGTRRAINELVRETREFEQTLFKGKL